MSLHQLRYSWAHGYASRREAEDALEDACAEGKLSLCDNPKTESYIAGNGTRAWRISLADNVFLKHA